MRALTDNIKNTLSFITASRRLKEFLEHKNISGSEYLPVSLVDTKGSAVSNDCFNVNLKNPVDCVLEEKSGYIRCGSEDEKTIYGIEHLALDEIPVPGALDFLDSGKNICGLPVLKYLREQGLKAKKLNFTLLEFFSKILKIYPANR